ncbi:MAG: hypothetical protein QGG48_13280 [Desulfatiglandales bacterium]|jgi:hypothetical protein|nr:hypothetical protein [Desulfatiglandales bacterium]
MSYIKSKSTKRFSFGINRNPTAKKAGSNTLTISAQGDVGRYSSNTMSLTMTVKEAQALQSFLNENLSEGPSL